MSDPADIESQRKVEDDIEAATVALEVAVLAVIARRLGKLGDNPSTRDVYAVMPSDIAEISAIISVGEKSIRQMVTDAMDRMAADNDEWAAFYYAHAGRDQVPASEHFLMRQKLREKTAEATRYVSAACRSSVIRIGNGASDMLPVEAAYRRVVSAAATNIATGAMTGQQATSQAVRTLSRSGLRVQYASGLTRNLYSAVSMNVMDSYRVAMGDLREIQGMEFGADGVEVSAHAESAPDHLPYQGRQYSYADFDEIQDTDLSARPLETGANCGHIVFPVILGISSQKYTQSQLRDMERRSNGNVTVTGLSGKRLTMTRYEATQYQRQIETSIRKGNETAYLLREGGTPDPKLEAAIKARTRSYKRISKEAGVRTRMERTRAYVL